MDDRAELLRKMDGQAQHFGGLSRRIWEFAEVGYKENKSSELLKSELRAAGFQIQEDVAGIPTAFIASWGQGRPVIAILGEYDAVELLREHVPQSTRIHYIITHGGSAPNVVPDFAEAYYGARHPDMSALDGIWARIVKCAEAAALATETRMEREIVTSYYNVLPNDALTALLDRNLRRVGGIQYSSEEQAFAKTLRNTFPTEQALPLGSQEQIQGSDEGYISGSTDVGDVSWIVPTAQLVTATYVPGTPGHSWQSAACAGMSIGRKGTVVAAKVLALTAVDLFTDPKQMEAARDSFNKRRAGHEYRSRIPSDQKPPLSYRDK